MFFGVLRDPPAFELDVGSPGDERFLRRFSPATTGNQATFRWSGPESELVIHGANTGRHILTLRIDGGPFGRTRRVSLGRPGHDGDAGPILATFDVEPGWHVYRLELSLGSDWTPELAPASLTLACEPYRRAADGGLLGVKVDWIRLERAEGRPSPPPDPLARALVLTWALATLAELLRRLDQRVAPHTARRSWLRVGGPVGMAGLALAWLARRDPYTLGWAVPPTPALLSLLTVALFLSRLRSSAAERAARVPKGGGWSGWPGRWIGWGLLLLAQTLLYVQVAPAAAIALGVVGGVVLLGWPTHSAAVTEAPTIEARTGSRATVGLLLGCVFLLALGMRFYEIRELPYGMFRDEACIGLVALRMIEDPGYRPAYVDRLALPEGERPAHVPDVALPGGGLYVLSLGVRLFGITPWSMRPITALAGALTVLPLCFVVRRLTGRADVALVASGLLAVSSWHVTVSRLSFSTVLHPLCELTGLACLMAGLDIGRSGSRTPGWLRGLMLVGAGAALGAAVQTYHTARVTPLIASLLVVLAWRGGSRPAGSRLAPLALASSFALTAAPLIVFAWRHPGELNARPGQVFLLSEAAKNAVAPLAALDDSVERHLLMLNVRGDTSGRRNVPGRPMVDPLTGIGFLAGAAMLLKTPRDWRGRFLLGAVVLGLLPSILAVEGPHARRSIGAVAFVCAIAAIGWTGLFDEVARVRFRAAAAGAVVVALGFNLWTYFVVMPRDERVWNAFSPIHTQIGKFLRETANRDPSAIEHVYVEEELTRNAVVAYLAYRLRFGTFNEEGLSPPVGGEGLRFVLPGHGDARQLARLTDQIGLSPVPVYYGPALPDRSGPSFVVYGTRAVTE